MAWDFKKDASSHKSAFLIGYHAASSPSLSLSHSTSIYFPSLGQTDGSVQE